MIKLTKNIEILKDVIRMERIENIDLKDDCDTKYVAVQVYYATYLMN